MRPDGGKEGEGRMRFGDISGVKGRFLFVCFVLFLGQRRPTVLGNRGKD